MKGGVSLLLKLKGFYLIPPSLQSAAASSGRTVVDSGINQELQETNTRLRERLARMVLHTSCTHKCKQNRVNRHIVQEQTNGLPHRLYFQPERCEVN